MLKIDRSQSISNLGARVTGIDISKDIKSQDKELLKSLWSERSVLIFPNQKLHHKDFERFSLIFGEFGEDPFIDSIDDHPNIIEVKKEANEKASHFGGSWHSDWSFQKKPPSATLLHSKTIPPIGGDTLFANTIEAYEGLPNSTKKNIDNLKVIHSAALPYADDGFYALETVNKNVYIFGIAMDEAEKKEVINEANKIYNVEEVIPSIYLASELSRTKVN